MLTGGYDEGGGEGEIISGERCDFNEDLSVIRGTCYLNEDWGKRGAISGGRCYLSEN